MSGFRWHPGQAARRQVIGFPVVGHLKGPNTVACLLVHLFMAFPVLEGSWSGLQKCQQCAKVSTKEVLRRSGWWTVGGRLKDVGKDFTEECTRIYGMEHHFPVARAPAETPRAVWPPSQDRTASVSRWDKTLTSTDASRTSPREPDEETSAFNSYLDTNRKLDMAPLCLGTDTWMCSLYRRISRLRDSTEDASMLVPLGNQDS